MDWTADAERGLTFIVYELAGDPSYDVIQSFFLSPGALYVLVVNLSAYVPQHFYPSVGYFLHWLGSKVPHAVVCMVGTHADLCAERELEEKCLDIHHQIAQQEKRDAEGLQNLVQQVDEALGQDFDLRCSSPHAAFYGVSDKNLRRKKAQFQYLLNHRPQILSSAAFQLLGPLPGASPAGQAPLGGRAPGYLPEPAPGVAQILASAGGAALPTTSSAAVA